MQARFTYSALVLHVGYALVRLNVSVVSVQVRGFGYKSVGFTKGRDLSNLENELLSTITIILPSQLEPKNGP